VKGSPPTLIDSELVKALPDHLRSVARDIQNEFLTRSWSKIEIGLPDYTAYDQPSIFVRGTSPKGERKLWIVPQSEEAFSIIRRLLEEDS
jgi:hypothetical protein